MVETRAGAVCGEAEASCGRREGDDDRAESEQAVVAVRAVEIVGGSNVVAITGGLVGSSMESVAGLVVVEEAVNWRGRGG